MTSVKPAMTFVVPGDLHLTEPGIPNHLAAQSVICEINELIKPDFVQFIGDNVQDASESQFELFASLARSLNIPYFTLVGDHDICGDAAAALYCRMIGEPVGAMLINGVRFIRLNTLEIPRLGFSRNQLHWLREQFEIARAHDEQVVVFQHHYPFKVCEDFAGPGIESWREVMSANCPTAIICGHTHYYQIANNGQQVCLAVRSIGDPEGGAAGYLVAHLDADDFAVTYRTIEDSGPVVLITHPRDSLLATDARHIVLCDDRIKVRTWSLRPIHKVTGIIDEGPRIELEPTETDQWTAPLLVSSLSKGEHQLRVDVETIDGLRTGSHIRFFFDPTRRFTAVPGVYPVVNTTRFC